MKSTEKEAVWVGTRYNIIRNGRKELGEKAKAGGGGPDPPVRDGPGAEGENVCRRRRTDGRTNERTDGRMDAVDIEFRELYLRRRDRRRRRAAG